MKPTILAEEKIAQYTIKIEQWNENERGLSITSEHKRFYFSQHEATLVFDFLLRYMGRLEGKTNSQ